MPKKTMEKYTTEIGLRLEGIATTYAQDADEAADKTIKAIIGVKENGEIRIEHNNCVLSLRIKYRDTIPVEEVKNA